MDDETQLSMLDEEEKRWNAIGAVIANLANHVSATRLLTKISLALVAIDLVLSVFFAVGIYQSRSATQHANRAAGAALVASKAAASAKHTSYVNCIAGNQFRRGDKQLWDFILSLAPDPNPTPTEKDALKRFQQFLAQHDAQRTCTPA